MYDANATLVGGPAAAAAPSAAPTAAAGSGDSHGKKQAEAAATGSKHFGGRTGLRARNIYPFARKERNWGKKRNYKNPAADKGEVGWEPGIDVRHTEVELGETSTVTIVDYNASRYRIVTKIDKHSIHDFIKDRQDWATVRWINVNGLSWDVLRAISEYYNLHPLAVEDMVDIPKRTKADHYKNQTFCTLPLHKLVDTSAIDKLHESLNKRSHLAKILGRPKKGRGDANMDIAKIIGEQKMMTMDEWNNPRQDMRLYFRDLKRSLARYHEVVAVEQVSIFLIEDHTIISFFEISAQDVETPIIARLTSANTLLREYPEASLLLQAILDGIVDIVFGVVSEYQRYIAELEYGVLSNPSMDSTRDLHVLSKELAMLKRTLIPIYSLVMALREHADVARNTVLGQTAAGGHISEFAKMYLSDVADHVLSFTDNLDMMRNTTENMINLIFNTMSVQENEAMRQLTLVTILFLPLTFLTGYFGMNFNTFGALNHSTLYFWQIAIPVTVFVLGILAWAWVRQQFRRLSRYYDKKTLRKRQQEHADMIKEYQETEREKAERQPVRAQTREGVTDHNLDDVYIPMNGTPLYTPPESARAYGLCAQENARPGPYSVSAQSTPLGSTASISTYPQPSTPAPGPMPGAPGYPTVALGSGNEIYGSRRGRSRSATPINELGRRQAEY
ncbi:uncharacterized protein V1510DRAFT_393555 [Dipodascopsis tothii]|uniref:uncharacterized protein n=1 Tax=Dipodascopsis tothii TaxID=44089 RepID=UPI0034CD544E